MKNSGPVRTAMTMSVGMFILFFLYQISLWSISSSTSPNITVKSQSQGKQAQELNSESVLTKIPPPVVSCDRSHYRYDLCHLNGSTMLDPVTSTLFLLDPNESTPPQTVTIHPYPRKFENFTMSRTKEFTLTTISPSKAHCDVYHDFPALVFSTGGYTGNVFHDFNEGFIPLFVTLRTIFSSQAPVFVIANFGEWWLSKYDEIIRQLTPHPVIVLANENVTHCFSSATIGLITHGFMSINPRLLPHSETFYSFRSLLGNAYLHSNHELWGLTLSKPRLLLASRKRGAGRVIRNQAEVIQVAEKLGFEVVLFEPSNNTLMRDAYSLINSSHAMIGVHGAALTHFLFLRPGAVFIQVVPVGIEWLAETCFGNIAKNYGVEYMEYKITVNESSLVEKYGMDYVVSHDPDALMRTSYLEFKKIYLVDQDVILDLKRVGNYLKKAYKKAKRFMEKDV
ncbi:protein O-GlcNAc transferase [Ranunculus cassubicifolius]